MRVLFSVIAGTTSAIGLFWLMQFMATSSISDKQVTRSQHAITFLRARSERPIEKRKRVPPPKPEKLNPELLRASVQKKELTKSLNSIAIPKMDLPINIAGDALIGDAMIGLGEIATGLTPVVYIPPEYPYRARRLKKEGFVELEFTISETGHVRDIRALKASPPGLFDRAAIRAVSKWKFEPQVVMGSPIAQRAAQVISFTLNP
jgi:protein TonB